MLKSSTTYTYVYCHIAAKKALHIAETEKQGSLYFRMMAGVFSSFTVEAFLNHIGKRKIRGWDNVESKLGPYDKLIFIQNQLNLTVDKSRRPYGTLKNMLKLRNALAHGKTEIISNIIIIDKPIENDKYPEPQWKILCSPGLVRKMFEDSESIIRDLNKQIGGTIDPLISPGHGDSIIEKEK
jgi:hypothetical protein